MWGLFEVGEHSILLVEDEPISSKVITDTLQQAGYKVHACQNGKQAVELIEQKSFPINLILLDSIMPEMDGLDFLHWRNVENQATEVPVIMLTAVADNEAIVTALEAGAQEYLTKPVEPEQLLRLVKMMVG